MEQSQIQHYLVKLKEQIQNLCESNAPNYQQEYFHYVYPLFIKNSSVENILPSFLQNSFELNGNQSQNIIYKTKPNLIFAYPNISLVHPLKLYFKQILISQNSQTLLLFHMVSKINSIKLI